MTRTSRVRTTLVATALLGLTGCSASDETTPVPAPPAGETSAVSASPAAPASPAGPDLTVAESPLGRIVVDRDGRTTYYFADDEAGSGRSVCTGECLQAWPPVVPGSSTPTAEGVSAEVGVITRDDQSLQVTVAGRPVYRFAKDAAPGDVTGQGVGKVWYVIGADGTEITRAASS